MYATEREILKLYIGWEDGWENEYNFNFVKRVIDTSKITNNVISILLTVFHPKALFTFLSFLLPIEFNMPNIDVLNKMCRKIKQRKKDSKKYFEASKNEAFFKMQLSPAPQTKKQKKSADADNFYILNRNKELSSQVEQLISKEKNNVEQIDNLKIQVSKLETEVIYLNSKNKALNAHCNSLSSQLETMSIRLKQEEQFQLFKKKKLKTAHRKFASARAKNVRLLKKFKFEKKNAKISDINKNSCQICKYFASSDKDLVVVDSYLDYDNIGSSELFCGFKLSNPQTISVKKPIVGKKYTYIKLGDGKSYSKLGRHAAARRSKLAFIFLRLLACSDLESDLSMLFCDSVSCEKSMFHCVANKLGLVRQLSVSDAVELQSQLRMPTAEFRRLRRILCNLGARILPSEPKIRQEQEMRTMHVSKEHVTVKSMLLYPSANEAPCLVPVLMVKNLITYIEEVFNSLHVRDHFNSDVGFCEEVWLLFAGDKGGKYMKFHFEVVNSKSSGSVYDVHLFCMYQGSDCRENIALVLGHYANDIKRIQSSDFKLKGKIVRLFLGGDFHFIDDVLGHQGSAASFPSSTDLVKLNSLRNHASMPHTPANCNILRRTIKSLESAYNENLCEDRQGGNLRALGKFHNSIIAPVIFPIITLDNVVPPVLHIMLGVVLKLYKLLLKECKILDCQAVSSLSHNENVRTNELWAAKSFECSKTADSLRLLGNQFVDVANLQTRWLAFDKNISELECISLNSSNKKKTCKQQEKCASIRCLITKYDCNIDWVQCGTCQKLFHQFCEIIGGSEKNVLCDIEKYECLACQGEDLECLDLYISEKISFIRAQREVLDVEYIRLQIECEDLEKISISSMGTHERSLYKALEDMKVERQAYHGNVFVGNHCKIVLRNHYKLCSVIDDEAIKNRFVRVFSVFNNLQPILFKRKFLSDAEISELHQYINLFAIEFHACFPKESITRKMHELIFNVPLFVKLHKTIGLLSEEEGECLHNSVNKELRQLHSVRNQEQKLHLVLKRFELHSKADRKLQASKVRKCVVCSERGENSFYRQGLCLVCGHQI
ncbi:uncharacterized protein LOC136093059 [Hydra vulgaris]|uniref:uncharacterized protein LOC136093059 n=1 Tax=Hydra vulgaris TaxID=6087 RepID=UPI0032EA41DF